MDLEIIRHSLSHIMAAALQELYPDIKFGIGPSIENGFYYDIDLKRSIAPDDLQVITDKMKKIIKQGLLFEKETVDRNQALKIFSNQPYKIELINELPDEEINIYRLGDFVDLCRGPHISSTAEIDPQSFHLHSIAGAYWRGDEKNSMLQRIYGYAMASKEKLDVFLNQLSEAQKRDHRLIGKKLELFQFDDKLGPGLVIWLPRGSMLKRIVQNFVFEKYLENGYQSVDTPHIARLNLWQTSGHADFYRESMFPPMHLQEISEEENDDYQLRPMNCPFHILAYQNKPRSYRDLPIRYAELGTVYRYEKSGVLHGLTRVRGFTQDDAHIWCTIEQLPSEIKNTLDLALEILGDFGFKEYDIYLSTCPEKYIGSKEIWDKATNILRETLDKQKINYQIDEAGGAFYGPKIDIKIKDSIGRSWQCTTIQVDFNLPEKFDLSFTNKDGKSERPIMIHRALLGALERFIGVLIEHYGGQFPLWLSPTQVMIIPIADRHIEYAQKISHELSKQSFRVAIDNEAKTVNKKILQSEEQQIPFIVVVGNKEIQNNTVSVRERHKPDLSVLKIEEFIKLLSNRIKDKT